MYLLVVVRFPQFYKYFYKMPDTLNWYQYRYPCWYQYLIQYVAVYVSVQMFVKFPV